MEIRLGTYRVVPYSLGTCWQLEKYGSGGIAFGKPFPPSWRETGHYPGTLHHAVEMLVEYATRGSDGEIDLSDPDGMARLVATVDAMVTEAVERIEIAAGNAV